VDSRRKSVYFGECCCENGSREPKTMGTRLTESAVANLEPAPRDQFIFDGQLAGFGYRLTPAGRGIFFVGKPRRTIGYHPELKIAEARDRARQILVDLSQGRDPIVETAARNASAKAGGMTLTELAAKWLADSNPAPSGTTKGSSPSTSCRRSGISPFLASAGTMSSVCMSPWAEHRVGRITLCAHSAA
jgi:Arm DNA-binding domain